MLACQAVSHMVDLAYCLFPASKIASDADHGCLQHSLVQASSPVDSMPWALSPTPGSRSRRQHPSQQQSCSYTALEVSRTAARPAQGIPCCLCPVRSPLPVRGRFRAACCSCCSCQLAWGQQQQRPAAGLGPHVGGCAQQDVRGRAGRRPGCIQLTGGELCCLLCHNCVCHRVIGVALPRPPPVHGAW